MVWWESDYNSVFPSHFCQFQFQKILEQSIAANYVPLLVALLYYLSSRTMLKTFSKSIIQSNKQSLIMSVETPGQVLLENHNLDGFE